ncbi:MAG: hypothetical protein EOP07_05150 [Proteobacteria bacterium]|nr:MAG: hypothetical protein EOP07_05150 [Pseudomonadota bacterium]
MNSSASAPRGKTYSLKLIVWVIALSMAATAVYMAFIIKAVPKTISNSKAGIFAEMVDHLLVVYKSGDTLQETTDYAPINATLSKKFGESPWGLRSSDVWTLDAWSDASVHERPLLLVRYHDAEGRKLLLGVVPISKRNFPRTGGFSHKDAWFFTFGKDYTTAQAEAAFPSKQVPDHLAEVTKLENLGLNLVATNYGNDFFILMLSNADSKELGNQLFKMSSIFEISPQ